MKQSGENVEENEVYDNWKKRNRKMIMLMVLVLLFAAALFIVFFFELFPLADEMAKGSSVTPADMKLYGVIFSVSILMLTLTALVRKIKEDPEKVFAKSLRRCADTTQNPGATLKRLRETWESGEQLRDWCHMDEEYISSNV